MTIAVDPHRATRVGARRSHGRLLLAPTVWGIVRMPASGLSALLDPGIIAITTDRGSVRS